MRAKNKGGNLGANRQSHAQSESQIQRVDSLLVAEYAEAPLEGAQFSMVGYTFQKFAKWVGDVLVEDAADETIQ